MKSLWPVLIILVCIFLTQGLILGEIEDIQQDIVEIKKDFSYDPKDAK